LRWANIRPRLGQHLAISDQGKEVSQSLANLTNLAYRILNGGNVTPRNLRSLRRRCRIAGSP
jgi:hypothetical protein